MRKNCVATHCLAIQCHNVIDFIRNGFQLASYSCSHTLKKKYCFIYIQHILPRAYLKRSYPNEMLERNW